MNKILLFNGCSFVAGDALTWNKYFPGINWFDVISNNSTENLKKYNEYVNVLRPQDNLAAICSATTGLKKIDLSVDGNNNQCIALRIINFLNNVLPSERSNYHVCVGWTELDRKTIWLNFCNEFVNVHKFLLIHRNNNSEYQKAIRSELGNYIRHAIIDTDFENHVVDYFANIQLLENYLIANNVTYTFWRSLRQLPHETEAFERVVSANHCHLGKININSISTSQCWINFGNTATPWTGEAVNAFYKDQMISQDNIHPNLDAVNDLAKRIIEKIY